MNDALKQFAAATNNELFDPDYKDGEWMIEAVETQETIEHFIDSSKEWNKRTLPKRGEIAGFPFVAWYEVQLRAEMPRRKMSVVDLGEHRFALDCDLTDFV